MGTHRLSQFRRQSSCFLLVTLEFSNCSSMLNQRRCHTVQRVIFSSLPKTGRYKRRVCYSSHIRNSGGCPEATANCFFGVIAVHGCPVTMRRASSRAQQGHASSCGG